jgi:DNA mismatch endonuclease (patch repair protein)
VQFPVPGAPRRRIDVAFTRLRIAVYLDGCFWHGCEEHPFRPKRNREYWQRKFAANRVRDAATSELLSNQDWLVLRFWEHEQLDVMVRAIERAVEVRRTSLHAPVRRRSRPRTEFLANRA